MGVNTRSEHKYRVLSEVQKAGHCLGFDVLYYAQKTQFLDIQEEIGEAEGRYIRQYRPLLNTQIPDAEDWNKYEYNAAATEITAEQVLQAISE